MKVDIAYGKDIDDDMMQQLLYMETAAYAFYDAFDDDPDSAGTVVAVLTDETLSHFKRRSANTLFLMKTRQNGKRKKLVAMACLTKKDKSHKLLHTVYVNAAYRNAGIGKALVKAALSIAKRDGMALSLSVNPLNEAAMQLYESTGFRISNGQTLQMMNDCRRK